MRLASRVVAVLTPMSLMVAAAGSASADAPAEWPPGEGLSKMDVLLIFGGIPLALFLVIGLYGAITAERSSAAGHFYAYPQVDREALESAEGSEAEAIESRGE